MTEDRLRQLLQQVAAGRLDPDAALVHLRHLPFEDLTFAKIDQHRAMRRGVPEVIFGEGKTAKQIATIGARVTRTRPFLDRYRGDSEIGRASCRERV